MFFRFVLFLLSLKLLSAELTDPLYLYPLSSENEPDYSEAVSAMIHAWETDNHHHLKPGSKGRVGLKIYTHSGRGLHTPPALVRAVAQFLEKRGFESDDILLFDLERHRLRETGYLPPLSYRTEDRFEKWPVVNLNNEELFLGAWYYESALPPEYWRPLEEGIGTELLEGDEDRKSYLPAPLLFDVDFWINLPVAVEHPVIGISGALANASLWNVSNQARFFRRPVSAATAAAEIAAIPELQRTWLFSILSLEKFQIVGGPRFNAHYTHRRNEVLLSSDPLILDRYALSLINTIRMERGFNPILPDPLLFRYGEALDLGNSRLSSDRVQKLENHPSPVTP